MYKNPNIKKAHIKDEEFTPEQLIELDKCLSDPIYFIDTYVRIQHPSKGAISIKLRSYQRKIIEAIHENRDIIVLAPRQAGKSQSIVSYILWYAIFNFDKFVLIASNKNKSAMEMIRRLRYAYEHLPTWLKPGVEDDGWNMHSLKFDNGSIIESTATAEDSGRSFSISLLYLDEFAYVGPHIQDAFWSAIEPTLAEGEKCIITSTPNNDDDIFSTLWTGAELGVNGFTSVFVDWNEPPGRDEEYKRKKIAKLGQVKWDREYELKFVSADAVLIDPLILANLSGKVRYNAPINVIKDIKFYKEIEQDKIYVVGVDPSTGVELDFSSIEVLEFPTMIQAAEYRSNKTSTNDLYTLLKNLLLFLEKRCHEVYFSVENNGVGEGIISLYEADENAPLDADFVSEIGKNKRGFYTTGKSKRKYCVALKETIEKNHLDIRSKILVSELKAFVRKHGSWSARAGATDDCISAIMICLRVIDGMAAFEDSAHAALYGNPEYEEWAEEDLIGGNDIDDEPLPFII